MPRSVPASSAGLILSLTRSWSHLGLRTAGSLAGLVDRDFDPADDDAAAHGRARKARGARKRLEGKKQARVSRDKRSQPDRLARLRGTKVDFETPPASLARIPLRDVARRMNARVDDLSAVAHRTGLLNKSDQRDIDLDLDEVQLLADELGIHLTITTSVDEDVYLTDPSTVQNREALESRPPIVTVMGHVDHGKTTLLDSLRKSDVAAAEEGGITQSIGAFRVPTENDTTPFITFLDTPGHEAFTAMRARGVQATDIVVLVVAADDGVMPQTVEAANHAIAAETPIIVAVTKCDMPGADPPRVRDELFAKTGIHTEQEGGDTQCVNVSAVTGENISSLLDSIALQADLLDLRSCVQSPGEAICIEAKLDNRLGPVTSIVTRWGSFSVGDHVVSGSVKGRIRALLSPSGEKSKRIGPGEPAALLGFKACPEAGSSVIAVPSEIRARRVVEARQRKALETESPENFSLVDTNDEADFPVSLIVKADVKGSADAVVQSIHKMSNPKTPFRVIHSGVGQVTRTDVSLAEASGAVIYTFNTKISPELSDLLSKAGLRHRKHSLIYKLLDDLPKLWEILRGPKTKEVVTGYATVERLFDIEVAKRRVQCGGCRVTEGLIARSHRLRVLRGAERSVVFDGSMDSLRHFKENVREVRKGQECGIGIADFSELVEGDILETYETIAIAPADEP